ncbi:MAG: GtrA family protein [Thermoplasmata archaeon]|nr:GtrA family protein [Thermoplasmata archaeon]
MAQRGGRFRLAETIPAAGAVPPSSTGRRERIGRYLLAWTAGALPAFAVITALWLYPNDFHGVGEVALGAFALMFPVAVRQLGVARRVSFVHFLLGAGIVFAVGSILTGAGNGLTDEPYTTPRYVSLLLAHRDPFVVPLVFDYVQYGQTIHSQSTYLYLPLLMFFQVPGTDYKWFAVGCWVLMVLVVRKQFDIAVMLAQPYVAIIAASGYNDLVVLLFMTLAFVGIAGRRQKWAEWLALGMKQFANAITLVYYLIRRDWRNVAVTAGVTTAFLVPFLLWSGPAIICPAVFADRLPGCTTGGGPSYLLNYSVWVVWVVAVFYPQLIEAVRRRASSGLVSRALAWGRLGLDDLLRLPAFVVVGISGVFVNLCVFTLLGLRFGEATLITLLASAAAFGVAMMWNFTWNRAWAFEGRGERSTAYHLGVYGAIQVGALVVNLVVLAVGVSLGEPPIESQLFGVLLGSVLGYAANLRWNFPKAPTAPAIG